MILDPNSHLKRSFQSPQLQLLSPLRRSLTATLLTEFERNSPSVARKGPTEEIKATRILDLPGILNDYYINILDWAAWDDEIAVALGGAVWTWNARTSEARLLLQMPAGQMISALAWHPMEPRLAVGTTAGRVMLLEVRPDGGVKRRHLTEHSARVTALSWNGAGEVTSGGKDLSLCHHFIGSKRTVQRHCTGHSQEICGIKWSTPATHLLATGGNDNRLLIWDERRREVPLWRGEEHCAAVKALAWAPHRRGLLASGGGTADRCIKLWDVVTPHEHAQGELTSVLTRDTSSQVCALLWAPQAHSSASSEIVSAHGFSEHQCIRWRWPEMRMDAVLRGHTQRVLFMAGARDGMVATASPDETLRLWKVFKDRPMPKRPSLGPLSLDASHLGL